MMTDLDISKFYSRFCCAGNWVRDQRCGQGVYRYANGDVYEGEWLNDKRNGKGTYTYAKGGSKASDEDVQVIERRVTGSMSLSKPCAPP